MNEKIATAYGSANLIMLGKRPEMIKSVMNTAISIEETVIFRNDGSDFSLLVLIFVSIRVELILKLLSNIDQ